MDGSGGRRGVGQCRPCHDVLVAHAPQPHQLVGLLDVVRSHLPAGIHRHAEVLCAALTPYLAGNDEGRRAVVGDAVVLQPHVLIQAEQRYGCRPRLVAVEARQHQLAVHHHVRQLDGVLVGHPAALLEEALLPDGYACAVVGQCHARQVGCRLLGTVDGLGAIPLGTRMFLGVVDAVDAAGALHGLVQLQRVLQVLLGYLAGGLLQHHEVSARNGYCVVVGASAQSKVAQIDGVARGGHLHAVVVRTLVSPLIDDAVAAGNEFHGLAEVNQVGDELTGQRGVGPERCLLLAALWSLRLAAQVAGKALVERIAIVLGFDEFLLHSQTPDIPGTLLAPAEELDLVVGTDASIPAPGTA